MAHAGIKLSTAKVPEIAVISLGHVCGFLLKPFPKECALKYNLVLCLLHIEMEH
jgi:hypothetical protein